MNQNDGNRILHLIGQQLQSQFEVELFSNQCIVITPMLYPDNTPIALGVELSGDHRAVLTDNGEAADYAFVNGLDESVIQERIRLTIKRFNLSDAGNSELMLEVAADQIAEGIFNLATAVQDVAYLVYVARSSHVPQTLKTTAERL